MVSALTWFWWRLQAGVDQWRECKLLEASGGNRGMMASPTQGAASADTTQGTQASGVGSTPMRAWRHHAIAKISSTDGVQKPQSNGPVKIGDGSSARGKPNLPETGKFGQHVRAVDSRARLGAGNAGQNYASRSPSMLRIGIMVLFLLSALPFVSSRPIAMGLKFGDPSDIEANAASPDMSRCSRDAVPADIDPIQVDPAAPDMGRCSRDALPVRDPSSSSSSTTPCIRRRTDSGMDIQIRGEYEIYWGFSLWAIMALIATVVGLNAIAFTWYYFLAFFISRVFGSGRVTGDGDKGGAGGTGGGPGFGFGFARPVGGGGRGRTEMGRSGTSLSV